jgi:hypothetical protein
MRPIDNEHKILFARTTRRVIVWIVTVLALVFTVLQVKGLSTDYLVNPTASTVMWRGALIVYFWCWRFGCIFDTDIQELAYAYLPHGGRWNWQSYGIVALLIAVAAALVWSYGDIEWFAGTMTLFFLVDHGGWRYLVRELAPSARKSEQEFKANQDYFALERLRIVRAQIGGDWKWWRFGFGAAIIVAIDLFAFVPQVRTLLAAPVHLVQSGIAAADAEIYAFSFVVLLFVIVMEVWHYLIRLRTKFRMEYLGEVTSRYSLQKR